MQLPRPQLVQLLRPPAVPGVAVHRVLGPVPPRPAAGRGLQGLQGPLAQSAAAHVSLGERGHVSRVWLPRVVAVSPRLRAPDTHQLRAELSLPRGGDGVGGAGNKLIDACIFSIIYMKCLNMIDVAYDLTQQYCVTARGASPLWSRHWMLVPNMSVSPD